MSSTARRSDARAANRTRVPAGRLLWSLVDDVEVEERAGGGVSVVGRGRQVELADPSPTVRDVLWRMALGPVALQNVAGLQESFATWTSGGTDCVPWFEVKAALDRLGGFVVMSLAGVDSTDLMVSLSAVDAVPDPPALALPEIDPHERHRLLASARLDRPGCGCATLADPDGGLRVHLHAAAAIDLVLDLAAGPRAAVELARPGRSLPVVLDVLACLAGARLITPVAAR